MEPYLRLGEVRERCVPGEDGIGLAGHESPADGCHIIAFQYRKSVLESTSFGPGHVLGTYERTSVRLEGVNRVLLVGHVPAVVVI